MKCRGKEEKAQVERLIVEWGLRINCAKNGCVPFHSDDGRVFDQGARPTQAWKVSQHATDVVSRTVAYSPWMKVDDGPE